MDSTRKESFTQKEPPVKGVVTARKCESCGHHEIGIIKEKGDYLPLKLGMKIEVIGECAEAFRERKLPEKVGKKVFRESHKGGAEFL